MKKKITGITAACLLAISLAACSSGGAAEAESAASSAASEQAESVVSEQAESAAEETAEESEAVSEAEEAAEPEEDPYADPDPAVAAQYPGTWVCGRASMTIEASEDDTYMVFIDWGGSVSEVSHWEYTCYFDGVSLVDDGRGVREEITYSEDGEVVNSEIAYSDGAATFTIKENGMLIWKEFKEDAAADMEFERVEIVTPAPDAEAFAENYFRPVSGYHPGTAGSSLQEAQAAYAAVSFADDNELFRMDQDAAMVDEVRANMLSAWESLTDEERAAFDENILSLSGLVDSCFSDWESVKPSFEDAGVAEQMEQYIYDPLAPVAWDNLFSNTMTIGNDEG